MFTELGKSWVKGTTEPINWQRCEQEKVVNKK